jgi:hypothetical protein
MSSHKRASGANEIYSNHLFGKGFNNNPATTRTATIERMYHRILTELATNRFKWDGLPDSIDVRFLEMKLFYKALAVFYFDKEYDQYLALDGTGTSYVNMLDNPTAFQVIGNHFVGKTISAKNCVPIWANYVRMPDIDIVQIYSHKLANLDRSIEINSANARQTKVIVSSENQRLTTTNISRQIDEGVNNIAVAGAMQDLAFIQALDLGVNPDTIEKLHIVRTRLWNECMGLMGLENSNQDKTERLVSGEADANNDQTSAMRYVNLNARRIAATAINKKYPELNVSVRYYTDEERNASMDIAPVTDNDIDDGVDE